MDAETFERLLQFHGHLCPGLAMGVRAAEVALSEIGRHSQDDEVVAIAETDMCGVDAVQFLTGCTFGKGNLVHRDHGKNAYTFVRRSDGKAIRVSGRPHAYVVAAAGTPDRRPPLDTANAQSNAILNAPLEQLYDVQPVQVRIPPRARVRPSVLCAACGEPTMETRIRRLDGRELCLPCFEDAFEGTQAVDPPRLRSGSPPPVALP